MKKFSWLIPLMSLTIYSCQPSKTSEANVENENNETKQITSTRTYAEISVREGGSWNGQVYEGGSFKNVFSLRVPDNHTDHSFYIRYEGPGWESEKIGYRLYLDWRNAIDIFGKVKDTLVLSEVGQDGFGSYHEMAQWGMDILKVGKSLGIGSIGRFINNEVIHFKEVDSITVSTKNSNSESGIEINYFGWSTNNEKINITSRLTIAPGERKTLHQLELSEALPGFCTGIVKSDSIELLQNEGQNAKWSYIATYGNQTLNNDGLGLAIIYRTDDVESIKDTQFDHLIMFKPKTEFEYYLLGAWEKEENAITSKDEFISYLNQELSKLN